MFHSSGNLRWTFVSCWMWSINDQARRWDGLCSYFEKRIKMANKKVLLRYWTQNQMRSANKNATHKDSVPMVYFTTQAVAINWRKNKMLCMKNKNWRCKNSCVLYSVSNSDYTIQCLLKTPDEFHCSNFKTFNSLFNSVVFFLNICWVTRKVKQLFSKINNSY